MLEKNDGPCGTKVGVNSWVLFSFPTKQSLSLLSKKEDLVLFPPVKDFVLHIFF
jgi:hypothetical protein